MTYTRDDSKYLMASRNLLCTDAAAALTSAAYSGKVIHVFELGAANTSKATGYSVTISMAESGTTTPGESVVLASQAGDTQVLGGDPERPIFTLTQGRLLVADADTSGLIQAYARWYQES